MAKALLKFRCYRCDKLLGISPGRSGKTTTCPKCQADLIVPEMEFPPDAELRAATRALVPNLDESDTIHAPEPKPQHAAGFSWEDLDATIFETAAEADAIDLGIATAPAPPPQPEPVRKPEPEPEPVPMPVIPTTLVVEAPLPIVVPEIKVEAPVVRTERTSRNRPNEVVLTQGVIASWSVFMLLALAISFVAGVFVGHFFWRGP